MWKVLCMRSHWCHSALLVLMRHCVVVYLISWVVTQCCVVCNVHTGCKLSPWDCFTVKLNQLTETPLLIQTLFSQAAFEMLSLPDLKSHGYQVVWNSNLIPDFSFDSWPPELDLRGCSYLLLTENLARHFNCGTLHGSTSDKVHAVFSRGYTPLLSGESVLMANWYLRYLGSQPLRVIFSLPFWLFPPSVFHTSV